MQFTSIFFFSETRLLPRKVYVTRTPSVTVFFFVCFGMSTRKNSDRTATWTS